MTALQRRTLAFPLAAGSIGWAAISFKNLGSAFVLGALDRFDPAWSSRVALLFVAVYPLFSAALIAAKPGLGRLALLVGVLGLAAILILVAAYSPGAPVRLPSVGLIGAAIGLLLVRSLLDRAGCTEAAFYVADPGKPSDPSQ